MLGASLVAYVALWIGDALHGVFAAMGTPQVVILTTVVAIAAALFALSRHPAAKGLICSPHSVIAVTHRSTSPCNSCSS